MKKILTLILLMVLLCFPVAQAQKTWKSAQITFEMLDEGTDTLEMGRSLFTHAFKDGIQVVDLDLMNGLMRTRLLSYEDTPEDSKMYFEVFGIKYEIIDLSEEFIEEGITIGNLKNATDIRYDKKDKKKILGFKCYKAYITLENGEVNECYITEKIAHPNKNTGSSGITLAGYPLEIVMTEESEAETVLKAIEVLKEPNPDIFLELEGYEQISYDEFDAMTE